MLCSRAAKVNASNMGGDAPLHIAVSFGQQEILYKVWDIQSSFLICNWFKSVHINSSLNGPNLRHWFLAYFHAFYNGDFLRLTCPKAFHIGGSPRKTLTITY